VDIVSIPEIPQEILLGHFNAKVGRKDILKPAVGNESLYRISGDNGFVE
jgi:hypothetical protein